MNEEEYHDDSAEQQAQEEHDAMMYEAEQSALADANAEGEAQAEQY